MWICSDLLGYWCNTFSVLLACQINACPSNWSLIHWVYFKHLAMDLASSVTVLEFYTVQFSVLTPALPLCEPRYKSKKKRSVLASPCIATDSGRPLLFPQQCRASSLSHGGKALPLEHILRISPKKSVHDSGRCNRSLICSRKLGTWERWRRSSKGWDPRGVSPVMSHHAVGYLFHFILLVYIHRTKWWVSLCHFLYICIVYWAYFSFPHPPWNILI